MATTKAKSESMKNKSKMWGGDAAQNSKGASISAKTAASKSSTAKSASNSKSMTAKSATAKSATAKSATARSAAASKTTTSKSGSGSKTTSKASATRTAASKASSTGEGEAKTTNKGGKSMKGKSEFASDMTRLNDVEIVSDVLNAHKGLIKLYGTALCESSCENMRQLVGRHLTECGEDQFDVFLYMSERNLYPTDDATPQKLSEAKSKFKQYEKQMKR